MEIKRIYLLHRFQGQRVGQRLMQAALSQATVLDPNQFTADVIFPGGLNPRIEELITAAHPSWEVLEVRTQRESYGKTTAEWHRRLVHHESEIRAQWGDKVYEDYDRYLSTCVRAFANHWSSDVQMKLRKV